MRAGLSSIRLLPVAPLSLPTACARVQELVAFSVPHADLGEVVGVAVVMQKGRSLTLEDLRAYAT